MRLGEHWLGCRPVRRADLSRRRMGWVRQGIPFLRFRQEAQIASSFPAAGGGSLCGWSLCLPSRCPPCRRQPRTARLSSLAENAPPPCGTRQLFYLFPYTTLSFPERSFFTPISLSPARDIIPATASACEHPISNTSQPPGAKDAVQSLQIPR